MLNGFNHDAFKRAVLAAQPDATYIVDGIISSESWYQSRVKVLFILKETNGYPGSNIAKLIRTAIVDDPKSKLWRYNLSGINFERLRAEFTKSSQQQTVTLS